MTKNLKSSRLTQLFWVAAFFVPLQAHAQTSAALAGAASAVRALPPLPIRTNVSVQATESVGGRVTHRGASVSFNHTIFLSS
ncbi:MAG: hypothetical protein AAB250_10335, partial [Bdellovibrionota bacterium]